MSGPESEALKARSNTSHYQKLECFIQLCIYRPVLLGCKMLPVLLTLLLWGLWHGAHSKNHRVLGEYGPVSSFLSSFKDHGKQVFRTWEENLMGNGCSERVCEFPFFWEWKGREGSINKHINGGIDRYVVIFSQKWDSSVTCKGWLWYYKGTSTPAELELQGYCANKVGPEGEEVFCRKQGWKCCFGSLF